MDIEAIPLRNEVLEQSSNLLCSNIDKLSRRLIKNFLLILGKIDPILLSKLDTDFAYDPLLSQAYKIASAGLVHNLFKNTEPDVIRQKYYSTKYRAFDDDGEPSPF